MKSSILIEVEIDGEERMVSEASFTITTSIMDQVAPSIIKGKYKKEESVKSRDGTITYFDKFTTLEIEDHPKTWLDDVLEREGWDYKGATAIDNLVNELCNELTDFPTEIEEGKYEAALERMYDLIQMELSDDSPLFNELQELSMWVEQYEKQHHPIQ